MLWASPDHGLNMFLGKLLGVNMQHVMIDSSVFLRITSSVLEHGFQ